MSLKNQVDILFNHVKSQRELINYNSDLFNIYEGDLLPYVIEDLKNQLTLQSFEIAKKRIPPINVLQRLTDKLSQIYQQQPVRYVDTGSANDEELLNYYQDSMNFNSTMNASNEFYNLYKNNLIMPYIHQGKPGLRSISSDMFTVYSDSDVEPTKPSHLITFHKDGYKQLFYVYTDQEFMIFDSEKKIRYDLMARQYNEDGINIYGKIPGVYINRSRNLLIPKPDTDIKKMVILLPLMLADLNFGVMMQAFSILYGIDLNETGMTISPNAMWMFKSHEDSDKKPELGVLKPQIDIQPTLELIQAEISMWLQTKGIKPGAVGQLTAENFASGISKMIDEMDTSEERQKQVSVYTDAESQLWDLIINHMHPVWLSKGEIDENIGWSDGVKVITNFHEQLPLLNRGQLVGDLKAEVDAGFTTKRRAIKKLNPRMSDNEIDTLMDEITDEQLIIPKTGATISHEDKNNMDIDQGGSDSAAGILNGAQVTAIVTVVKDVAAGLIPREAAVNLIMTSFQLSRQQANAVLGNAGQGFQIRDQNNGVATN